MAVGRERAPYAWQSRADGLIYVDTLAGHRGAYLDLLAPLLGLAPLSGPLDVAATKKLLSAPVLFLATFDDRLVPYCVIALLRSVLGRPTTSLLLRPQSCFERASFRSKIKWAVFRTIRRIPHLQLLTITPFSISPRYCEVAHAGVWDPQYWDLLEGRALRVPQETLLSREISGCAGGRKIVCLPGFLSHIKGFDYLLEILQAAPSIAERFLVVAAGPVQPEAKDVAEAFSQAGGMLVNRLLDDAELESLYLVSDAMWVCYSPAYDQASGIFGRALQLSIPVIVRSGSLIEKLAADFGMSYISLEFGSAIKSSSALLRGLPEKAKNLGSLAEHVGIIEAKRIDFIRTVAESFGSKK